MTGPATQADACLIDLFMPGMPGVEAVRELRARHPTSSSS
jgi:DNA-binding NarL/FixJ family response regulator